MLRPVEEFDSDRIITFNKTDDDLRPNFSFNHPDVSNSPPVNYVNGLGQQVGGPRGGAGNLADNSANPGLFTYFLHNESNYVSTEPNVDTHPLGVNRAQNSTSVRAQNNNHIAVDPLNDSNHRVERMIHGFNQAQRRNRNGASVNHSPGSAQNEDFEEEDPNAHPEEDDDDEELEVGELLKEILYVTLMFQGFFLLMIGYFYTQIPLSIIFGYLWFVDVRSLLNFLKRLRTRRIQ